MLLSGVKRIVHLKRFPHRLSHPQKLVSLVLVLIIILGLAPMSFAEGGDLPLNFVDAKLVTTNHLTEPIPADQKSVPDQDYGASIKDYSDVPLGLRTVDLSFDKNIITYWDINKNCIILKDVTTNDNVTITPYYIGKPDNTGSYKQHIFFDATFITNHSYRIRIDSALKANNGNTIQSGETFVYFLATGQPLLTSAETTSDGTKITLAFNRAMANPSANANNFAVKVEGLADTVTAAALKSGDATKIELTLVTPVTSGKAVTVDYTPGTVASVSGYSLADFIDPQSVTNTVAVPDYSAASAALVIPGSKQAGANFEINISEAKDREGNNLSGTKTVIITSGTGTGVYSGTPIFSAGAATVSINQMTTAGDYTLTVAIDGVTPHPTVEVNITAATVVDPGKSSADIDQPLAKGASRTVTVTFKDIYNNPMAGQTKATKAVVTVTNNNSLTNETYTVAGTAITASILIAQDVTTDSSGKYSFNITLPAVIDPGDGIAVQVEQSNSNNPIGSPFTYNEPAPKYTVTPVPDPAYTIGETSSGIDTMTVNAGAAGMKYFTVVIGTITEHPGSEKVVFTLIRNGVQTNLNATGADFDLVHSATAGFNIVPGDVVKAYIVDDLTNAINFNPTVLE